MGSALKNQAFLGIAVFLVERSLGIMNFLLRTSPGK